MFEYHGWVCLRPTAGATDDAPELELPTIRRLVDLRLTGYGLIDLRALDGEWFEHTDGLLFPVVPTLEDAHGISNRPS